MQMLYQSDQFVVVRVDLPADGGGAAARGGYEIVDRIARAGAWIDGAVADGFRRGVEALVERGPEADDFDEFISGYLLLARQPLTVH